MEEVNIKEFFNYLKKYILIYILVGAVAVEGIFLFDTRVKTPLYQSTAKVVLVQQGEKNVSNSSQILNDVTVSQKLTSTYSEIAKSELVLDEVIKDLNLEISAKDLSKQTTVASVDGTSILNISVKNEDSEKAAQIANKIAEVFSDKIAKIYKIDNVSNLDEAKPSNAAVNETTKRDMIIAAALSVFGVTALVFLLYTLDDTIRHTENIEAHVGTPVIGKIIEGSVMKKGTRDDGILSKELVVEGQPKSIVSESIKNLRTNLQFSSVDNKIRTILITSSNPGEGKSYVSSNLAASFAQAGEKVLMIDCDLRKGRLHKLFRLNNKKGLSNLLTNEIDDYKDYVKKTNIKKLEVMPRGPLPPNPSELLASNKNKALIEKLKQKYDIIILDGAPCNGLADPLVVATLADTTLIVARELVTTKTSLRETKESLDKVDAKVAGVVINRINQKSRSKYYYYYGEDK